MDAVSLRRHDYRRLRWSLATLLASVTGDMARAQSTELVSVSSSGTPGGAFSAAASVSADGRYVAFHSAAADLAPGDTNVAWDVFVRDRASWTTELVSVDSGGVLGNAHSSWPAISSDGRFVAFASHATNLVTGDTNGFEDTFVHDRLTGTTVRVSVATGGTQGNDDSGLFQAISADGRYVAFSSEATNLVAGDTNAYPDIFVRDCSSGTTERVSVATGGALANVGVRQEISISADGRFVGFDSASTNLVAGDGNGWQDVFVRDRLNGTTEIVSLDSSAVQVNADSDHSSLSADGRFVAFVSSATNLVAGDTNGFSDVFVRDRVNATTVRVSVSSYGAQGDFGSRVPVISADGRMVAFESGATNLFPNDLNAQADVFLHDLHSGTTERVSVATDSAPANFGGVEPSISADGRSVAFESIATNLVPGDTNGFMDVFARDYGPPPSPYCFGDGTGTACPCGPGAADSGCPNSVDADGGRLDSGGTPSTTVDTFRLIGTGMPNSSALYLQGATRAAGGAGIVFGDGLRCVGGAIIRLGTKGNANGASRYPEAGDLPVSVRGLVTVPGNRTYHVWYRNAATFCSAATFNLTNGLEMTWIP